MAKAVAARAGVILTLGSLPARSNAHTLTIYPEVPLVKMFDFIDPCFLVTVLCVWAATSYIFVAGIAYLLGRMSSPSGAFGVATLRPPPRAVENGVPGSEVAIFTTRFGKYWHRPRSCTYLATTTQVFSRDACPACVQRAVRPRADGVAETPPGSQ